jgi:hypothetical protein
MNSSNMGQISSPFPATLIDALPDIEGPLAPLIFYARGVTPSCQATIFLRNLCERIRERRIKLISMVIEMRNSVKTNSRAAPEGQMNAVPHRIGFTVPRG